MRKVDLPGSDMRQPRNDKGDARGRRRSKPPTCDLPLDIYAKTVMAGATYIDGRKLPLKCRIHHYGQLY